MQDIIDGDAVTGAPATKRRAPSAGGRLFRDGLIEPEIYEALVAADARAWNEFLAMDEAALDEELGEAAAAEIDALTGRRTGSELAAAEGPALRLVANGDEDDAPAYDDHFRLRVAGIRDGLVASRREIEREVTEVRRLLMSSQRNVLTDAFVNLAGYIGDGRMLLVERIEHGVATIEACLCYDYVELPHVTTGVGGPLVCQRVMRVRILAVLAEEDPHGLASRLWLEAQLIGAVRTFKDGGPDCFGMICAVDDRNDHLPSWIERAGVPARLVWSDAKVVTSDRTLLAFREFATPPRDADGARVSYRLAIANRASLFEAARLHHTGSEPFPSRGEDGAVRFDYEVRDQLAGDVAMAARAILLGNAEALCRFGLEGASDATLWGPPSSAEMSQPIGYVRSEPALVRVDMRSNCSARLPGRRGLASAN